MQVVKISKKQNSLIISLVEEIKGVNNFINSNNIYNNEILYSFSYVLKNKGKVKFCIDSLLECNIKSVVFTGEIVALKMLPMFYETKKVLDTIYIDTNESISMELYKLLCKLKNVKSIKCYFMPENYISSFTKKNISVYFTFKRKFSLSFIESNGLKDMKNIYYKRNIDVSLSTLNDFIIFLTINRHLRIVHIYEYDLELIRKLIHLIKEYPYLIVIHFQLEDSEKINKDLKNLRKLKKEYKNNYNGEIELVYPSNYLKQNMFKEFNYTSLKVCSIIMLYLGFVLLISNKYNDYVTWFNSNVIMNTLSTDEITSTDILVDIEPDSEPIIEDVKEEKDSDNIPTQFSELLSINKDTVGWISLKNTKINYPVTQSGDNEYYLNRDFYNNKTANGWVFMDYRNDSKDLDQNTIIYGHALLSGYMFGDLRETIKSYWYKNEDNLILSFSTINQEMKWEVFSIYRTPYTTDYLKTNFYDDASFLKFIDTIKERSVYNFAVSIGVEDKILTLSTCTGNDNSRLVLHAKLIK